MSEVPAATPTDAAPVTPATSLDDRIASKFGLDEPVEAEESVEATPSDTETPVETEVTDEPVIEDTEPEPKAEPLFKLKHNGAEKEVPVSEAQRLAQMGYDYEFKMQRVNDDAVKLKQVAQAIQAREAMRAQVFDALVEVKAIEKQLAPFSNVDWVAEGNADPIAAFQKRMQHDQLVQAWHQANAKAQQLNQPIQHATQQLNEAQVALEAQKLLDRIPEWKDESRKAAESKSILEAMQKNYGFKAEEIANDPILSDHRVISILRDAWKYQQAVANSKAKKGPIQGLPKAATPGAKPVPRSQAQQTGDIKRALRQTQDAGQRKALTDELIARKFGIK